PDEREGRPPRHLEAHVAERPEVLVHGTAPAHDRRLQGLIALVVQAELLAHAVHDDGRVAHNASARSGSARRKTRNPRANTSRAQATHSAALRGSGHVLSYRRERNTSTKCTMGLIE